MGKNEQEPGNLSQNNNSKNEQKKKNMDAHDEAEKDISKDADLSIHSPNDDLDEEEMRKLNADKNLID